MSSIRSILEDLKYKSTGDCELEKEDIDQALLEISELIDGAKPGRWLADPVTQSDTTTYFKARGHDDAIDQYQSNLEELLK